MEIVSGIAVVAVTLVAAVVACLIYLRVGDLYRQVGRTYIPSWTAATRRANEAGRVARTRRERLCRGARRESSRADGSR